jgi:hypothetical protein
LVWKINIVLKRILLAIRDFCRVTWPIWWAIRDLSREVYASARRLLIKVSVIIFASIKIGAVSGSGPVCNEIGVHVCGVLVMVV